MSTALYRRYRPDTFADVIGQEHVTAPLVTALGKDAVSHAYLFSGPRGCGKTTSARILARCLNCAEGSAGQPCGECDSCRDLATGGPGSLDVIEIDAASHGGVDDARDLRERATFAPVRDRYKIFIIDEAHMVTAAGFNALLKIVEEPPEHIKFIFATTEPDKVIGTIRSRTHHYPFRLVPPEPLMKYLEQLCAQENVPVAPGVLQLVIRAGGGSVRDTLSVLDQLIAGSTDAGLDYDRATALLGFTHATLLDDVVESTAALDGAAAFNVVDRVVQSGQDPRRFVEDLLERLRDLIIVKSVPDSPGAILRGVPDDQIDRMKSQAAQLGSAELSRAADITAQALTDMMGATSPRLHLELLMARLLLPHAEQGHSSLAARLERLERRLDFVAGAGSTPAGEAHSSAPAPPDSAEEPTGPADPAPAAPAQAAQPSDGQQSHPAAPSPPAQEDQPGRPGSDDDWGLPAQNREAEASAPGEPTPDAPEPAGSGPERSASEGDDASSARQEANTPTGAPGENRPPVDDSGWTMPGAGASGSFTSEGQSGVGSPGGTRVEMMRRAWPDVVEAVKGQSRMLWMLIKGNVSVTGFDGQTLTLAFSNEGARSTFANRNGDQALNAAIQQVLGMQVRFDLITGDAPREAGGGPPKAEGRPPPPAHASPDSASSEHAPEESSSVGAAAPGSRPAAREHPEPALRQEDEAPLTGTDQPDAPAWVAEEPPEEHEFPYETEPDPPQEAPSPHPAWNGEPSSDPAGVTDQDDPPEQRDPFDGAPVEPSAQPESDAESYRVFDEKPPVPVFARQSPPDDPVSGAPGPGAAPPRTAQTDASDQYPPAPSSPPASEASGRIAQIRRRMAQRRSEADVIDDTPPPPDPFDGAAGSPASAAPQTASHSDVEEEEFAPSEDDVALEESGVFGRKAIERFLGGTLIEERRLGED